uniref:Uncharacterized protein n=1 Tax=Pyxicephalus adspersus TaxID=30357 RepID=A0AAV3B229_PYXAD|nr:TPA: hypothetical protein GDO54_001907 [Pyxicephalus adspersus]
MCAKTTPAIYTLLFQGTFMLRKHSSAPLYMKRRANIHAGNCVQNKTGACCYLWCTKYSVTGLSSAIRTPAYHTDLPGFLRHILLINII